ncbi:MAG: hypothetical protein H6R23_2307 [Proteobacteria bacterium]|nr:hypothetical protein [Pseudomonadota bacterium]
MDEKKPQSPRVRGLASILRVDAGLANACLRPVSRAPAIKPTHIGCVFGRCNLKVGVLPREAYAALLEEL